MVKIDHYSQVQPLHKTKPQPGQSPQTVAGTAGQASPAQAAIDPASVGVQQAFAQLSSQSEVDQDKVAAIRQALADGSLLQDDAVLAQSILDLHKK